MRRIVYMFPSTTAKTNQVSPEKANVRIQEKTRENVAKYKGQAKSAIENRLEELDYEWDIERVLEVNMASLVLLSSVLGFTVHKNFFGLGLLASAFMIQHAIQGWCPPLALFRLMGIRTMPEIDREKAALKRIRKPPASQSSGK